MQSLCRLRTQYPCRPAEEAETPANVPRHPLRFVWQTDIDGRFILGAGEFRELIGSPTAERLGRKWREIAQDLALDPQGRVEQALATHETWVGIELDWPVDDAHVPVELSGLPVFDRDRHFLGYRGFGICRDPDRLMHLAAHRRHDDRHASRAAAAFGRYHPGRPRRRSSARGGRPPLRTN